MRTDMFDFDLPRELIAAHPAEPRDSARMLEVGHGGGAFADRMVRDLPSCLSKGDIVVVNDTRVIPALLTGRRGAARISCNLHMAAEDDCWRAFAKPARKLTAGDEIVFADDFRAIVEKKGERGEIWLRFNVGGQALQAALDRHGEAPLPPYIPRADGPGVSDRQDYQTMFADRPGAVAAPTAGLHFTERMLAALDASGIGVVRITLHVGAGTFLPVTAEDTADHVMHAEWASLSADAAAALNAARTAGGRIVAVGSTSLRTLESATDEDGRIHPFEGETDIFITPGYRFRGVDLMLTNFHLPRSTLFMLVSAFSGLARMNAAYRHAIDARYRFFSYGDCCLLHPAAEATL